VRSLRISDLLVGWLVWFDSALNLTSVGFGLIKDGYGLDGYVNVGEMMTGRGFYTYIHTLMHNGILTYKKVLLCTLHAMNKTSLNQNFPSHSFVL